jgi:hypothetical protein
MLPGVGHLAKPYPGKKQRKLGKIKRKDMARNEMPG